MNIMKMIQCIFIEVAKDTKCSNKPERTKSFSYNILSHKHVEALWCTLGQKIPPVTSVTHKSFRSGCFAIKGLGRARQHKHSMTDPRAAEIYSLFGTS